MKLLMKEIVYFMTTRQKILMRMVSVLLILFTVSCESFSNFYEPWHDVNELQNVIPLGEGEEPEIIRNDNVGNEFWDIVSEHYTCIGYTGFNGPDDSITSDIKRQCLTNGATLAVYGKTYTNTRTGVYSTSYGVSSYNIDRYDYSVYYFVERTDIPIFGLSVVDLDGEDRQTYQRNTGAIVLVVYKNSLAFFENIIRGDIIVRINKYIINNVDDYYDALYKYVLDDEVEIEFVRNNQRFVVNMVIE